NRIYSGIILQRNVLNQYLGRVSSFEFAIGMFTSITSRLLFGFLNDVLLWQLHTIAYFLGSLGGLMFVVWCLIFAVHNKLSKRLIPVPEEKRVDRGVENKSFMKEFQKSEI